MLGRLRNTSNEMSTDKRFRGIPIVQSGTKYQTDEGFSAIKNGVKTRRDAEPLVKGQKPKWLRAKMPTGKGYSNVNHIVNENRPTPRCRHVETQHFALQHWREKGWLKMKHIPGTINAPDALTKGLAHLLHGRHSRQMMVHYKTAVSNTNTPSSTLMASQSSQSGRVVEAGEGVGT